MTIWMLGVVKEIFLLGYQNSIYDGNKHTVGFIDNLSWYRYMSQGTERGMGLIMIYFEHLLL